MEEIVVVSTARTPFGKFGGSLINMKAPELGGLAIKEALRRAGITGEAVDEVIMGDVITAGQGQVPARQAEILGGIPHHVPSFTINKVCGSALKAVTLATQIMKAGDAGVIVAEVNKVAQQEIRALPYVHWWTFLSWFHGIGEGQLTTLVSIREKLRKGQKLEPHEKAYYQSNKGAVDLKKRYSREETETRKALERLLDGQM